MKKMNSRQSEIGRQTARQVSRHFAELDSVGVKKFCPEHFQEDFMQSVCRFPAFIGAWGTGKTLCGFMKGLMLSIMYPGNSGLIIRRELSALNRSTIRDFSEWTKISVNTQTKIAVIPGSGNSIVSFSHADNLQDFRVSLQGMNLGWAVIEQVDEFDSAEVFNELDGRVRLILTPSMDIQKELVKLGVMKEIIRDFNVLDKDKREEIEEAVTEKLHLPVRQIMVTGNACGHNWVWRKWKKDILPEYHIWEAVSEDNRKNIPNSTLRSWEQLKLTAPKRYARMVRNSWEDYDIEGAYYAELMSDALKVGRVDLETLYDNTVPVYTFWDLGIRASDTTSIWFVQFIGEEIHLIDYLEEHSKGMNHYSAELSKKPYTYAAHYLPPDSVQRLQAREITTRLDIMRHLRREPIRVVERHRVEERIACVRGLLNRCKFSVKCTRGIDCLNNYKRKKYELQSTEETPVFTSRPADDEWTNGADSFGYMAIIYRYYPPRMDEAYNYYSADTEWLEEDASDYGCTNLLRTG